MSKIINFDDNSLSYNQEFSFPRDVFPNIIEEMINQYDTILNINPDYLGTSILSSISLACGKSYKIKIKNGWLESAVLWIILIGKAGINKSSPLDLALKPFKNKDTESYKLYKDEWLKYQAELKQSKKSKNKDLSIELPQRKQFLLTDFTPESLYSVLEHNNHGIMIASDEILTWLKNFNRYNSGGEEQLYLSTWSGREININRRSSQDIYIPNPFVGVGGTIQPAKLREAFAKGRDKNGFQHRFLFAYPDRVLRKAFSDEEVSESTEVAFEKIISDLLLASSLNNSDKIYQFDADSKNSFREWRDMNNDRINKEINDDLAGIYSKIEIYLPRIALILQILEDSIKKEQNHFIHSTAFNSAIRLIKYYEHSSIKVYRQISKYNDPLNNYSSDKKEYYRLLPTIFTTKIAKEKAKQLNIPERTVFEFFKDSDLFEKTKHGHYAKKI